MAHSALPGVSTLPFRLKFRQLALLDALGDSLSLRKAAAQTHLTQPAATRAMAELESAFGVQLFERSHVGMAPTVYGSALIHHARRVLHDVQQAHAEIQAIRDGAYGRVRIGSLLPPAARLLPVAIGELKQQLPGMQISVEQLPQKPLVERVRQGSLDIVLCRQIVSAHEAHDLKQTVLFDEDYVLVAAAGHRCSGAETVALADLVQDPWVLPHPDGALHAHVQAMFLAGAGRMPFNVVESTTALSANLLLVERYGFLNFMQRSIAETYARRGQVCILPIALANPMGPHVIAVREAGGQPPAVVAVVKALLAVAGREALPVDG